jgi:hypothetical protein
MVSVGGAAGSPVYSPVEIVRGRLLRSMAARADLPVRFICGPIGSGKTTVLRQYVRQMERGRYIRIAPGTTAAELRGILDAAADATEIVVDDLDAAEPAAVAALIADLAVGDAHYPPLILAGRARSHLHVQKLLARGLAVTFDGGDLAFDHFEIEDLADRLEIAYEPDDVTELAQATEGWTIAVTWILREASRARAGLRGAFERWSDQHADLLIEFIAESLDGDPALRQTFFGAIGAESQPTDETLRQLELAGCPITRFRTRMRPHRIFHLLSRSPEHKREREAVAASCEPLALTLLGRFSCTIGGRQIAFARRRDQNVLIFIALTREGRATREELLEAFWPGVSRTVASQGLRTTLSRLRRAIAEAAQADVERYLQIDANIALVLEDVVVDARRFVEHVELGRIADVRGDSASARRHYRAACGLYKDRLLISEAIEAPLRHHVDDFEALFRSTLTRLDQLADEKLDHERGAIARKTSSLRTTA